MEGLWFCSTVSAHSLQSSLLFPYFWKNQDSERLSAKVIELKLRDSWLLDTTSHAVCSVLSLGHPYFLKLNL